MTDFRPSQLAREILLGPAAPVKVGQVTRSVVLNPTSPVKVGQVTRSVVLNPTSPVKVAGVFRMIVRSNTNTGNIFRSAQVCRMVLMGAIAPGNRRMSLM